MRLVFVVSEMAPKRLKSKLPIKAVLTAKRKPSEFNGALPKVWTFAVGRSIGVTAGEERVIIVTLWIGVTDDLIAGFGSLAQFECS